MAKSTRTKKQTNPQPETSVNTPTKERGIMIMALGHAFYGRMAFNLAVSIKNEDPEIPICLVYADDAKKELFRYEIGDYFDIMIEAPIEYRMKRGHVENLKAKLHILDLTPFEHTLYLDADTIWLPGKKASDLLDTLMEYDFTIQSNGYVDLGDKESFMVAKQAWCHPREIKQAYGLNEGQLFTVFSEFMWIKNTEENRAFFEEARKIYDNPAVEYVEFAGGVPDELPISIAMVIHGIKPHQPEYLPIYWEHREKLNLHQKPMMLNSDFWLYSIGGKVTAKQVQAHYNFLADVAFQKAKLDYPYHVINKRDFLPERAKI